jgi:uncharacterized membrane protein
MSTPRSPSWTLLSALLLLSLVPVLAGAARLATLAAGGAVTPDNARFMAAPWPVALHILSATVFCVLGAFQFDAALRQQYQQVHRIAGRVLVACGLLAALTGLWMTVCYPIPAELQGPLLFWIRIAVAMAMLLAIVTSTKAVLQQRLAHHRAWMVRAYALGQGAGTQVLLLLPVSLWAGAPKLLLRDILMAAAWGLNVVAAEWILRRPTFST